MQKSHRSRCVPWRETTTTSCAIHGTPYCEPWKFFETFSFSTFCLLASGSTCCDHYTPNGKISALYRNTNRIKNKLSSRGKKDKGGRKSFQFVTAIGHGMVMVTWDQGDFVSKSDCFGAPIHVNRVDFLKGDTFVTVEYFRKMFTPFPRPFPWSAGHWRRVRQQLSHLRSRKARWTFPVTRTRRAVLPGCPCPFWLRAWRRTTRRPVLPGCPCPFWLRAWPRTTRRPVLPGCPCPFWLRPWPRTTRRPVSALSARWRVSSSWPGIPSAAAFAARLKSSSTLPVQSWPRRRP